MGGILEQLLNSPMGMAASYHARPMGGILDALMLPGQVAGGTLNVQPERPGYWSDTDEARQQANQQTMMNRATDLGGLMMLGGAPFPAAANELRAGIRPYQNVPQSLMGYRTSGPQRGYAEQAYKHEQPVEVVLSPATKGGKPDIFQDAMKGLNREHAVEHAYRNWPDAWHIRALD